MNSTVRKTIIFFSIIFIPFIVTITCPFIGYMFYLGFDTLFREIGSSIEKKKGLGGCDTVPLAGDKEQLAETFMANVDAIWTELHRNNVDIIDSIDKYIPYPQRWYYQRLCLRIYEKDDKFYKKWLSLYPSKYYKSYTDLLLYDKDKLLCMAFIVLRDDLYEDFTDGPPYFKTYVVIGKRENINDPFKIFIRCDDGYSFSIPSYKRIKYIEEIMLYKNGGIYENFDVYPIKDKKSMPVLSDPDFFEKHPLFEKFDDSTYNFEWYKDENNPEKYYRYDYPY